MFRHDISLLVLLVFTAPERLSSLHQVLQFYILFMTISHTLFMTALKHLISFGTFFPSATPVGGREEGGGGELEVY